MAAVEITPAYRTDIPVLVKLYVLTHHDHHIRQPDLFPPTPQPLAWETTLAEQFQDGQRQAETILVARQGGDILGYLFFTVEQAYENSAETHASVADISIRDDAQRRGIGRSLLDRLARVCRERGINVVHAQIWAGNTASESLFRAAGYEDVYRAVRLKLQNR